MEWKRSCIVMAYQVPGRLPTKKPIHVCRQMPCLRAVPRRRVWRRMKIGRVSVRSPGRQGNLPARWRRELCGVLITEARLRQGVRALARQIERDFAGRDLVIVALLNGTVMFLADLVRHLSLPLRLDFVGVSSYPEGTESRGLIFSKDLRLDVRGPDVLLVEDIPVTGQTPKHVLAQLGKPKPARLQVLGF